MPFAMKIDTQLMILKIYLALYEVIEGVFKAKV